MSKNICNKEHLDDYFEYELGDLETLEFLNGKMTAEEYLSIASIKGYLEIIHEKYCEDNNLCKECHSPLQEYKSYEEVWGSKQLVEIEFRCPRGCQI